MSEQDFLQLLHQHQAILHKICRLYRDQQEDREDLFQEIIFQLWKSYPGFKGASKITSWMYRIALNTAMAAFRKRKPPIIYGASLPEDIPDTSGDSLHLQQEQFFNALQQLDDGEKALITLYLEDLSYQEMAEISGINENYIGVKLNRIKTKIKTILNLPTHERR
ncbi:RNA polymerase sigma factor [Chitinophaga defluvii]|uniref:Sigma-70 family RNA polymerase sigma factor n=1 Tax=Chitinophaga defluvii TaxID=3163343 RepID=A0ABV2T1J6_9BACT